jgi:hypothetical protein
MDILKVKFEISAYDDKNIDRILAFANMAAQPLSLKG